MDFNAVANQFAEYYYSMFDTNRRGLTALYKDNSMLTFETNQVQGVSNVIEKLVGLPFQKVVHKISTLDAQPAGPTGSIIVLVTGVLLIDDNEHPQGYSQTFHLFPDAGSYYILNDIFRLVYSS